MVVDKSVVYRWISDAFVEEKFKSIEIELTGTSEKGDGYVGDIVFLNVKATMQKDEQKSYNLVIKHGKINEELREKIPVRVAFEREIFIYSKAVPLFQRFEAEKNVNIINGILPKCYGTLLYDKQEVLIFQNLRSIGYQLHDRYKPLDLDHLKLTFEQYGKWHGLGMAYKDQHLEEFNEVLEPLEDIFMKFGDTMSALIQEAENGSYRLLEKHHEKEILRKLRKQFPNGFLHAFLGLTGTKEANQVLLHGDCWNSNMMFKYNQNDNKRPEAVTFLDFQISKVGPPVLDLAYHLYSTASENELIHFDELLRIYYQSLTNTMTSLGTSNPAAIFSFEDLTEQWRKYCDFGFLMAALGLPIMLSDKEDVMDIQDMLDEKVTQNLMTLREKTNERLYPRLLAIARHFLKFK